MSVTIERLNLQRVVDKRIDASEPDNRVYNVLESGVSVSYYDQLNDGGPNISQLTWTLNPPDNGSFIDRRILMQLVFELTFRGTSAAAGIPLLQCAGLSLDPSAGGGVSTGLQYYDCPRSWPLARSMQTLELNLGGDSISQSVNQYVTAMLCYNNDVDNQDGFTSMTPTMPDQSQAYADLDGFARDPMRGYGDNANQCPRGGFVGATIVRNDSTGTNADVAIVRLNACELLDLSPLLYEKGRQGLGFRGISTMKMQMSLGGKGTGALSGLISSLWSHKVLAAGPQSTFSSASVVALEAKVKYHCIQAPPTEAVPKSLNYNYSQINSYPTSVNTPFLPGAINEISMNSVQLESVPTRLIMWVAPQDSLYNINSTDTFFAIDKVEVTFAGRQTLLAAATPQDLYQIARKNGVNLSWRQYTKDVGAVLALDLGEDIPMDTLLAPGTRGNFNLQVKVTCRNLASAAVVPTLNVIAISEGVMTIVGGRSVRNIGILSAQDVLDSKSLKPVPYMPSGSVYGGAWYDDVWSFIKRAGRPAINAAKAIVPALYPAAAPILEGVDRAAAAVGIGLPRKVRGGAKLSRAQLQALMR
jgi:hypothetical protein